MLADTSTEMRLASAAPPQSMAYDDTRTPASAQPISTNPAATIGRPAWLASSSEPAIHSPRLAARTRLSPKRRDSMPAQKTISRPLEIAVQRSRFTCWVVIASCSRRSSNTKEMPITAKVLSTVASRLAAIAACVPWDAAAWVDPLRSDIPISCCERSSLPLLLLSRGGGHSPFNGPEANRRAARSNRWRIPDRRCGAGDLLTRATGPFAGPPGGWDGPAGGGRIGESHSGGTGKTPYNAMGKSPIPQ